MTKPKHTFLTACTILTTIAAVLGVSVAAMWGGLDWRWIPTVLLAGLLATFIAGWADNRHDQRDELAAAAAREKAMLESPLGKMVADMFKRPGA